MKKRRIGIYGGKFDPPHLGHLLCAEMTREAFALDKVLFITSAVPPHKASGVTDARIRHEMVEAHLDSTHGTAERAVAGVTTGLIGPGDEVTWEARHFGVRQRLTVRITAFDRPAHFQDVMISGAFARMVHDHHFADDAASTVMRDRFDFASPLGPLGALADRLVLLPYLRR
ncbi:MAG TPA: adenylyltransferase/cytidyltransferase family protein, partial [Candidatus Obscuribacter sp.]|nr:adenylyltransferase/cytidyltransferase family protein [Candidatus Obscuribacter sp.]